MKKFDKLAIIDKYKPRSEKNQSPTLLPLFLQKTTRLPTDSRDLHKEKFRNTLKNNIIRPKNR